jgi:2-polyprenyl-6-hydroxyphenyl methylase/3-demethylubiquinone-9 3-methyltransferase
MQSTQSLDPKDRFSFGKNWSRFLTTLNDDRIKEAEKSLQEKLGLESLEGKIFLMLGQAADCLVLQLIA